MLALLAIALGASGDPVSVTPPDFTEAREAQVAIGADHKVYVAYGMGNAIYLSRSVDEGKSYGRPIKVAEAGKLSLGMRRGPRIAVHGRTLTVTATYGAQGGGRDGDLLAFRSTDEGKTWSGASRVNDVEGAAREGLHAMTAAADGTLACTWLDLRSKGTKLYASISRDGGVTWSKNSLAYASPTGTICECCHPSAAFDPKGQLWVMFRNCLSDKRDMHLVSSADNGESFSPAVKLGSGTWEINACPMDGGALAFSPEGKLLTVWRRDKTLYRNMGGADESKLGEGTQAWIAQTKEGPFIVWNAGRRLMASTPGGQTIPIADNANDGVVAASPDGKLVIAAWTSKGIQAARLKYPG